MPKECLFGPTSFLFEEAQHSGTLGNELPFPLFEIHLDPSRGVKDASPSLHAYGHSFATVLLNPFVLPMMALAGFIAGIAISAAAYFALRTRNLLASSILIISMCSLWIAAITPWSPKLGLFGALLTAICSIIFCRFSQFTQMPRAR